MAKKFLAVRTQKYSDWAADFLAASPPHEAPVTPVSRAAGRSRSPPAIPHRARAVWSLWLHYLMRVITMRSYILLEVLD
jgi:hypothetical protein